jgi:geranylgeranyl pyrophosphate synthase
VANGSSLSDNVTVRLRAGELDIALERVDRRIHEIIGSSDKMVLQYVAEVGTGRGKRIRPRMMIAVAELFGGAPASSLANCAACCELLHTATLIHDDIIDEAPTRRGNVTLNSMYGNEIAVVVGDYVLALVLKALNSERDYMLVDMLLSTSQELGLGVIEEVLNRNNFVLSVEKYYDIIYLKTASLFSLCCGIGGYLGGAPEGAQAQCREYGKRLGLAFQVVDDLLDLTADSAAAGKPTMNDIREGRITLPVIHALLADPQRTQALIAAYQEDHSAEAEQALKAHLAQLGSIRFAYSEAQRLLAETRVLAEELALEATDLAALPELARLERSVLGVLTPPAELAG